MDNINLIIEKSAINRRTSKKMLLYRPYVKRKRQSNINYYYLKFEYKANTPNFILIYSTSIQSSVTVDYPSNEREKSKKSRSIKKYDRRLGPGGRIRVASLKIEVMII